MGIEFNKWNRPVAYYLLKAHPSELFSQHGSYGNKQYERIPAEEIIHGFIMDRPSQSRGVPWMHSAMLRLRMLGAYEEAELVAAKMGFFVSPDGSGYTGADDGFGNKLMEADPGSFEQLPAGMDVRLFDPNHPNASFADFEKSILRGIASGLNISYATLANDLENVNFSSIRHGSLEDRDTWRVLQNWLIEHFCTPVYEAWLVMAITTGKVNLPMKDFAKYNKPIWRARGWAWVDPLKESHANEIALVQKTKTRSQIAADQGIDIEEMFQQIALEGELAKKYGIDLNNAITTNEEDAEDKADKEEGNDGSKRESGKESNH